MYSPSSSSSSQFLREFPRKSLLFYKQSNQSSTHTSAPPSYPQNANLDQNVFIILSVLLCGLICALGLNLIIRCVLKCSNRAASESIDNPSTAIVGRGIHPKALQTFPLVNYSTEMNLPGLDSECVICLSEFMPGERLRFLPKCNHGFHVRCIDKWLKSHTSCPKCRHCLLETCQKIMGCDQNSSSERIVNIQPLEPEGMVRDIRGNR
ncbi:hypothetical protein V6N13_111206 [Hibiscus sabdariffa]|uniref:RING-type E3 ubiquitin transferase n=1 Tax=Hibiscus sabdariffa TaxID=183260 RepID=A0ABR2TJH4_9ROSI